ncbi:MAG TPA: hypothetical protein VIJ75_03260 [Hanamia sp.]
MFVVNDIELLERLSKHKILNYLAQRCAISVAGIRVSDYSLRIRHLIQSLTEIKILHVEKADFDEWAVGRRKYLSISDLSTIYVALSNKGAILLLSPEDQLLTSEAKINGVAYLQFDDFFVKMIKDERLIQLYNLIKAA